MFYDRDATEVTHSPGKGATLHRTLLAFRVSSLAWTALVSRSANRLASKKEKNIGVSDGTVFMWLVNYP